METQWKPNLATLLLTVDLHTHTHRRKYQIPGTWEPAQKHAARIWYSLPSLSTRQLACSLKCPQVVPHDMYLSAQTERITNVWKLKLQEKCKHKLKRMIQSPNSSFRRSLEPCIYIYICIYYCDVEQHVSYAQDEWTSRRQSIRPQRQRCRHMQKLYIWNYMKLQYVLTQPYESQLVHLT